MKNHIEASSAAQKRAWIYIRETHTPYPYYNSLEETLRSFAATQNLAVAGVSIDFNRRRGGYGVSQMLQAANEGAFDILVVNSLGQLSDSLLSAFDLMACLDKKGIRICAPGRGVFNFKKMKSDYDMDRFMDELEEGRTARARVECYMGDCEPEDYDSDYKSDYDPNDWEKKKRSGLGCCRRW